MAWSRHSERYYPSFSVFLGTTLAMARDGHLPGTLSRVHPRFKVTHHAEVLVGVIVAALVVSIDLRGAIGFSPF
ncbi:putative amino acid transporter [Gordonia araii NBRC 100433]|uniref:Putative amino acid transporter n=1 Tax=Gordonia araii NBRC 100433 TaxID=1073574 RepID=G7GY47_9ACTN|nr:putative amino acid transporter [Gordonia araii NBRC 100433]